MKQLSLSIFLISQFSWAQNFVADIQSGQPIHNVRIVSVDTMVMSDITGYFYVDDLSELTLQHKDYYLSNEKGLQVGDTVFMVPNSQELLSEINLLGEVSCDWNIKKLKTWGHRGYRIVDSIGVGYMLGSDDGGGLVRKLKIKITEAPENGNPKMKLAFIEVRDTNEAVFVNLLKKEIILAVPQKKGWTEIDLSHHHIIVPEGNIAVILVFYTDSEFLIDSMYDDNHDELYILQDRVVRFVEGGTRKKTIPAFILEICH